MLNPLASNTPTRDVQPQNALIVLVAAQHELGLPEISYAPGKLLLFVGRASQPARLLAMPGYRQNWKTRMTKWAAAPGTTESVASLR